MKGSHAAIPPVPAGGGPPGLSYFGDDGPDLISKTDYLTSLVSSHCSVCRFSNAFGRS
jgi:hypothetical protein